MAILTQEDKELLLKDLSARLPYGVLVFIRKPFGCVMSEYEEEELTTDTLQEFIENDDMLMRVLPYLRPMSSMTEEEMETYESFVKYGEYDTGSITGHYEYNYVEIDKINDFINWLNAHHFDYRGLIEKGLAIEVTKENNPYERF